MKTNIMKSVTKVITKGKFKVKKYSPEILIIGGIVGGTVAAVEACKATTKAASIIEDRNTAMDEIRMIYDSATAGKEVEKLIDGKVVSVPIEYTDEDLKKDTTIVYVHAALNFAKLYAPAVILGTVSIASILTGHNILRKRNVALAAAYAAVDKGFKEYRSRVVERFGKELDQELRFNVKAKEFSTTVVDEKGKEKVKKETVQIVDPNEVFSEYTVCFAEGNTGWSKDPEMNKKFLVSQQNFANDKLKNQGYLFLNDVREMLGYPKTAMGQVAGWIYDEEQPIGDNYVDFGIFDTNKPKNVEFVNGYERSIWLDFNCDGNILKYM